MNDLPAADDLFPRPAHLDGFTVEQASPNSVCIAGELDLATAECFVQAVRSAWIDVTRPVDVDLGAVTFFDASGLKALLSLRRSGVDVRLAAVSESAQRVLDITGIGCLFGAGQIPPR